MKSGGKPLKDLSHDACCWHINIDYIVFKMTWSRYTELPWKMDSKKGEVQRTGYENGIAGFMDFTLDTMAWRDNCSNCFRLLAPWQIWVPQERNPQFSYNLAIKGGNRDGSLDNSCQLLVVFQITRSHLRLPWSSWAIGLSVPKYFVTAGLVPGQ